MQSPNIHFSISERKLFLRLFDVICIVLGLLMLTYTVNIEYFNFNNPNINIWLIVLVVYYYFFGQILELFDLKTASDFFLTLKSTSITVFITTLVFVLTPKITPALPENRLQILYFFITVFCSVMLNRLFYINLIFSPRFLRNFLIIGDVKNIERIVQNNYNKNSNIIVGYISAKKIMNYQNIKFYSSIEKVNLKNIVKELGIHEILVCSITGSKLCDKLNTQLINLFEEGMSIRSIDSFIENETQKISENQLLSNFYNYFSFSKSHQNNLYKAFRRFIDIICSLIGITLVLILIPFIFILNIFANKGSIFYMQNRVGKHGKEFKIIKFRTMRMNAEVNGAQYALKNDIRITPFGRILRKSRIDEFPQFFNVLKGEMSLIGPRPERPKFVKQLVNELPYYSLRHVVKPGLTGWAQVKYPYASSVKDQQEKLLYDLYYIKERNIILDVKIILKTISTILFFRGT